MKPAIQNGGDNELRKWLKANSAEKYVAKFESRGCLSPEDLDDEEIDSVIKKEEDPATLKRLKRELGKWKETQRQERERQPQPIPDLPPGTTFELGARQAILPDGKLIGIEAPAPLPTKPVGKVVSPTDLKLQDWVVIAKTSDILRAYNMDSHVPIKATHSVLHWKMPSSSDYVRCDHLESQDSVCTSYSAETASYVEAGFDSENASFGYLYASGSFDRAHKDSLAKASAKRTVHIVARYSYPRAIVYLNQCTETSPEFVKAIKLALGKPDAGAALKEVFVQYGHAIPMTVTLGGAITFDKSEEALASSAESQVEETYRAALSMKVGNASAAGGASYQTGSGTKVTAEDLRSNSTWTAVGGDVLANQDVSAWRNTVNDPSLWAAVKQDEMQPTYKLLSEELQKKILEVWAKTPPVLEGPRDVPGDTAEAVHTSGFVVAMRSESKDGNRGSVFLASGPKASPEEGADKTAAGAAFMHTHREKDMWYECNGICLPVRAGAYYRSKFEKTHGEPTGRLTFAGSKLELGDWQRWSDGPVKASSDGFLFASIEAHDEDREHHKGDRGSVYVYLNDAVIAGASVHRYTPNDNRIFRQSLCVPVPAGSKVEVKADPTSGTPLIRSYWMPVLGNSWKFDKAETVALATEYTAEADIILHGRIESEPRGTRGALRVYVGNDPQPYAGASVHCWNDNDRWIHCSSVMVPVPKGTKYRVVCSHTSKNSPKAEIFSTAIRAGG